MSDITMTPKEFMDECVVRMNSHPDLLRGQNVKFQYDYSQDGCGKWYLEIIDGIAQQAGEGEIENPTTTFICKYETLYHVMITGKINGAVAAMTGKLKTRGDGSYGMKLGKWCAK